MQGRGDPCYNSFIVTKSGIKQAKIRCHKGRNMMRFLASLKVLTVTSQIIIYSSPYYSFPNFTAIYGETPLKILKYHKKS